MYDTKEVPYLLDKLSTVEYPPRSPAPSARINSSSGVAPPVISDRINVKAFWLKYVCNKVASVKIII